MADILPPQSIEQLSFERILQEQKDWLINRDPILEQVLAIESETMTKLIENFAYRELHLRARVNDGISATMILTAHDADLDNLLLLFGVERLVITPADDTLIPPRAAVVEADEDFRTRGLLALEAFSTAGPKLAYHYHALSVVGVYDILASSPSNGQVNIYIMSVDGVASAELVNAVTTKLNTDKIRPLGTRITVASAAAVNLEITATLNLDSTPDAINAAANAKIAVSDYLKSRFKIGADIYRSAIYAALQQRGVESVTLASPATDIAINDTQFANITAINIS